MRGVPFVPEWHTSDFWPETFDQDNKLRHPFTYVEISRPFLMQKDFDFKSPFSGHSKFNFLALYFYN